MINKTGVILAGGKSSRMGEDKAFLSIKDKKFIDLAIDCFKDFEEVIIIANEHEKYKDYEIELYEDVIKDIGPIGGLYTALTVSKYDVVLIACDMPYIDKEVVNKIGVNLNEKSIISVVDNKIQPLCSGYKKEIIDIVKECIDKKDYKLKILIDKIDKKTLNFENNTSFKNINTKEEYKNIIHTHLKK